MKNNLNSRNLTSEEYCLSNGFPCCKCGLGHAGCYRKRLRPYDIVKFLIAITKAIGGRVKIQCNQCGSYKTRETKRSKAGTISPMFEYLCVDCGNYEYF